MGKKKHGEEYEETRDGAITYLNTDMNYDVISAYQKSNNINIRQGISVLINQRNSKRREFVQSIEEFDALKASIENDISGAFIYLPGMLFLIISVIFTMMFY